MTYALVASELAHAPTIVTVMSLCALFSALVGRWWTLAVPLVLAGVVLAVTPIDWYYERSPRMCKQASSSAPCTDFVLATAALLGRHYIGFLLRRRRSVRGQ